VRGAQTEIADGPLAVTKEVLAGYYVLDCAELDEALKQAARLAVARGGTVEVLPVMPADEWAKMARDPRSSWAAAQARAWKVDLLHCGARASERAHSAAVSADSLLRARSFNSGEAAQPADAPA